MATRETIIMLVTTAYWRIKPFGQGLAFRNCTSNDYPSSGEYDWKLSLR